jgi:hypothetical protein
MTRLAFSPGRSYTIIGFISLSHLLPFPSLNTHTYSSRVIFFCALTYCNATLERSPYLSPPLAPDLHYITLHRLVTKYNHLRSQTQKQAQILIG